MAKPTDLQSLLLAHAAGRESGSLHALPETLTAEPAWVMQAISQLLRRGLIERRAVSDAAARHRCDGDLSYGAFITAAGLVAIAVEPEAEVDEDASAPIPAPTVPRTTKSAMVPALLARPQGATLPELIAATGWLPHTTRAALIGRRKNGHVIERSKRDDATCYRIVEVTSA